MVSSRISLAAGGFLPVDKEYALVGKDSFKRDRLDKDPLGPQEDFFATAEFWVTHDTTFFLLSLEVVSGSMKKIFVERVGNIPSIS